MYKILLILLFIGLTLPMVASAFLSGPIVECGTKEANRDCTLCDIFIMVKNIIKFLMDLIIVIAPIFVVIGGIIILTGGVKPDQIALGKKIITSALVGIVIALLSWVVLGTLFNVLAKPAGEGGMPWAWNKIECVPPEEGEEPEEPEEQIPWCQRSAPSGSSTWILTDPPAGARPEQKGDASPELASFLNCMYLHIHGLRINSISSNKLCDDPTCDTSTSGCGHTANSCHYGGQYCKGLSRAVDFHATAETCSEIREAALQCDSTAWVNWEYNHVHISVHRTGCGCNEGQIPNPCPGD